MPVVRRRVIGLRASRGALARMAAGQEPVVEARSSKTPRRARPLAKPGRVAAAAESLRRRLASARRLVMRALPKVARSVSGGGGNTVQGGDGGATCRWAIVSGSIEETHAAP